jgi:acyl carrier protein
VTALRERLAALVASASDGAVSAADALASEHSLRALGLDSLGYLRLIDAVEAAYGVDISADQSTLDSLDAIAAVLAARGVDAG